MTTCDFEFQTETQHPGCSLRAWVDDAMMGGFQSDKELLVSRQGDSWTATFDVDDARAESACFWLRLAVSGQPGTSWRFTVRRRGSADAVLLSDADVLTLPKEWLVVTCQT